MNAPRQERLLEVDALRGVAALAVVLFHYTTRFEDLYPGHGQPSFSLSFGHLGVNLFFIVSGFVIFMTLERTRRPMDFVVSRFSRLFPAYWASIWVTFLVVSTLGLPGKEVTLGQAMANMLMVHGLALVPHVDGVYWTLEVEMIFYAWMLSMFVVERLGDLHRLLWLLLGARLVYHATQVLTGVDLSWTLSKLLITAYVPWFALGICVYEFLHREVSTALRRCGATAVAAIGALAIQEGAMLATLAAALAALVWAAAAGRLPVLRTRPLVFLGSISYPLYLLHENIGWVVLRGLTRRDIGIDIAIAVAVAVAIALATAMHHVVEMPALRAIRARYRLRVVAA